MGQILATTEETMTSPEQIINKYYNGSYWVYYNTKVSDYPKFKIKETNYQDNSCIYLDENLMDSLDIFKGDCVELFTKNKSITLVALQTESLNSIGMSKSIMKHLNVKEDDFVFLSTGAWNKIKYLQKITVSPLNREKTETDEKLLKEYYTDSFRPQTLLERFTFRDVDFIVTSIDDGDRLCGIVVRETVLTCGESFYGSMDKESPFKEFLNSKLNLLINFNFNFQ